MHLQSRSSVLVFSWREDSLRLASSLPWGSNALAFVVNDTLGRTSESKAGGALGQGWAVFMVPRALRLSCANKRVQLHHTRAL